MKSITAKLTSRKLWLAIAGVAVGIAITLGADTSDIETIAQATTSIVQSVLGVIAVITSVITYIRTEGKIDAESIGKTLDVISDAVDTIGDSTDDIKTVVGSADEGKNNGKT